MPKKKKPESHQPETSTPPAAPASTRADYTEIKAKESQPTESNQVKAEPPHAAIETRFSQAENFVTVYANHIFFAPTTLWDFRIVFGEITGSQDGHILVENRVAVTMPIPVAKILAMGIVENLRSYEKITGKTVDLPRIEFAPGPGGVQMPVQQPEAQK